MVCGKGTAVKVKPEKKRPASRKGKRIRTGEVIRCLRLIRVFFWYKCGKILAPLMRELMPFTASRPAFGITPETAGLLCRISPAAIGRHLKTDKAALKVKGESLTKSLDSLSSRIPIRTFYSGAERKTPGFRQTGTVRRCGQAAQGRYAYTLTATEVSSGWIALYSLLNNAHKWTFEALSDLKASSLLPIREFRSDNGSEFINSAAESWRRQERLAFTRSRGRKKNDNCFDGQKNGAAVREYAGYDRLAGCEEQALPAAVCRPLVPLLSFFMPAQKLTSKTRIGSKEIKVYDRPRSPFQRLSESEELPGQIKDALAAQCALYNPVELQHSVNKAILRLRQRLAQVNRIQTQERL